jgi:hypothetical protein
MWTWLPVIALIGAFLVWMWWVLHKRTRPRPGEQEVWRTDSNPSGGTPGVGGIS